MGSEIRTLKKDLVVHEEVEKELAKRSHFCQKVIEKYKGQIKDDKEELRWIKENKDTLENAAKGQNDVDFEKLVKNRKYLPQQKMGSTQLASFLELRIDEISRKLEVSQQDFKQLREEHLALVSKIQQMRAKYSRLAGLLTEYLDAVIEENPALIQDDQDLHLDIDRM